MDINFELYKVFYYIAKEGSVTAAAEKLYISQPAVTQALKKLEEELGGPLFVRKKNGVILTAEGQKLYDYLENSIGILNNASNLFSQYLHSDIGKVRVNVGGSWGAMLMPEILTRFHDLYPNVEVAVSIDRTSDAIKKLVKSELDIGIFEGNIDKYRDEVESIELAKIKYAFYTSKKYLKKVAKIDVNRLDEYDFFLPREDSNRMSMIQMELDKKGIEIFSNRRIAGTEMTVRLVQAGLGIGFFNEVIVRDNPDLIKVDLGLEDIEGSLSLGVKNQKLLSNAAHNYLRIVEEVIREKV